MVNGIPSSAALALPSIAFSALVREMLPDMTVCLLGDRHRLMAWPSSCSDPIHMSNR